MSGVAGAVAHVRPARKVRARFSKAAGARGTIAGFDPARCGMFASFVDALFDELPAGGAKTRNGDQSLPSLSGLEAVQPNLGISGVGSVSKLGRVSIGSAAR